jgi:hypothetical protein
MGVLFLDRVLLGLRHRDVFSPSRTDVSRMKSSNPGAEKMATRLTASLPRLSTEIAVPAGMKTVAPAWATLTEPPRCTRPVPVCKKRISSFAVHCVDEAGNEISPTAALQKK